MLEHFSIDNGYCIVFTIHLNKKKTPKTIAYPDLQQCQIKFAQSHNFPYNNVCMVFPSQWLHVSIILFLHIPELLEHIEKNELLKSIKPQNSMTISLRIIWRTN